MKLTTSIGEKIVLDNPLMPASGPLVGDPEKIRYLERQGLGGLVTKTISSVAANVPHPCIIGGSDYIINAELWSEYPPEQWENEFLPSLESLKQPLFISLGYKREEIVKLIQRFNRFATAFELSTHYVGTSLEPIAKTVRAAADTTDKPVFIKMSPHIPDPVAFAQMVKENGGYGVVAINSVGPTYPVDLEAGKSRLGSSEGFGWISGPVIKPIALSKIRTVAKHVSIPIIGVGGIKTADDVLEFIAAGASAVQMLSSAMLYGRDLYSKIIGKLPERMKELNIENLDAFKGSALKENNTTVYETQYPLFDHEKCTLCRICVNNCPYFALEVKGGEVTIDKEKCFKCGLCQSRCPVSAISGVLDG